jgi:hypothetical protein
MMEATGFESGISANLHRLAVLFSGRFIRQEFAMLGRVMHWFGYRRPRSRFVGSAGMVGAMAGAAIAGQVMIWCGIFRPGTTPNDQILDYWPGFAAGAAIVGFAASFLARLMWTAISDAE